MEDFLIPEYFYVKPATVLTADDEDSEKCLSAKGPHTKLAKHAEEEFKIQITHNPAKEKLKKKNEKSKSLQAEHF